MSNSPDFETQVNHAAQKAILKFLSDGGWLMPNYESRVKIPPEWLAQCWSMVDHQKVMQQVAQRLESELAERVVNHMAAELASDIKQILSVKERREAIRAVARDHLDMIMKAGL